jgi:hypothetical protein
MPRRLRGKASAEWIQGFKDGLAYAEESDTLGFRTPFDPRRLAPAERGSIVEKILRQPSRPKKKRRKTAYQSAYSAAYKRLKKKHPRMAFGSLSKKAHAAARKKVK